MHIIKVKKANLKRLHTIWFHILWYSGKEKNLWRQNSQWISRVRWRKSKNSAVFLRQSSNSEWYTNDEYMSSYICTYPKIIYNTKRVNLNKLWTGGSAGKEFPWILWVQPGFNPCVGKIPWRKERLPTPAFWPGEFHGLYSPWGCKESDMTERLSLWSSLMAQLVKNPPAMWEIWVWFLGWEDPLEKGTVTHSSILAGRLPWTV